MSKTVKWIIGIVIALLVLQFAMPFVWHLVFPAADTYGYGMSMMHGYGYGYGMHAPMMWMGYGFGTGFFGMWFMWLIPLGVLTLFGLGIAWLIKQLTNKPL